MSKIHRNGDVIIRVSDIVLQQDNLCYLEEAAEQFDKQYQKVDEQPA